MQALHIVNKIRIVFAWFAAKVAYTQLFDYYPYNIFSP